MPAADPSPTPRARYWLWLLLPAWMFIYGDLAMALGGLLGEGKPVWDPLAPWGVVCSLFDALPNLLVSGIRFDELLSWISAVVVWIGAVVVFVAIPVFQWLAFVLPARLPEATSRGSSMFAVLLCVTLTASILTAMPVVLATDLIHLGTGEAHNTFDGPGAFAALLAWLVSWFVWTAVLWHRSKGRPDALECWVSRALQGNAIGVGLSIPWYAIMRSRESCYCALGSFWSLVIGLWSLLMLGGPLLLWLHRRRRPASLVP